MKIVYSKRFQQDLLKASSCHLIEKVKKLVEIVSENPLQTPPPFEKLNSPRNTYSRRINVQHRLVYELYETYIKFLTCWGHYE